MFSPELMSSDGCVARLGDSGPVVVRHRSEPGKDREKDRFTAVDRQGRSLWSVDLDQLFPDLEREKILAGIVDDTVVVGAVVPHWWHGDTAVVATISANGTVSPPADR